MTAKIGKGGKRADLENRYFRSRMEANFARYLNWLKERGEIVAWWYEPDTFWFEGIKRGTRAYSPDFKIQRTDGSVYYTETKGWWDAESLTRRKRMAKYHPQVEVEYVDYGRYRSIASQVAGLIPHWERDGSGEDSRKGKQRGCDDLIASIADDPALVARARIDGRPATRESLRALLEDIPGTHIPPKRHR